MFVKEGSHEEFLLFFFNQRFLRFLQHRFVLIFSNCAAPTLIRSLVTKNHGFVSNKIINPTDQRINIREKTVEIYYIIARTKTFEIYHIIASQYIKVCHVKIVQYVKILHVNAIV